MPPWLLPCSCADCAVLCHAVLAARRALGLAIAQGVGAADASGNSLAGRWAALEGRTTYERLPLGSCVKTDPFSGAAGWSRGMCSGVAHGRARAARAAGLCSARCGGFARRLPMQICLTLCFPCPPCPTPCRPVCWHLWAPRPRAAAGVAAGGGRAGVGCGHQADGGSQRARRHRQLEGADWARQPAARCAEGGVSAACLAPASELGFCAVQRQLTTASAPSTALVPCPGRCSVIGCIAARDVLPLCTATLQRRCTLPRWR